MTIVTAFGAWSVGVCQTTTPSLAGSLTGQSTVITEKPAEVRSLCAVDASSPGVSGGGGGGRARRRMRAGRDLEPHALAGVRVRDDDAGGLGRGHVLDDGLLAAL